jgi:hypothetical protein
VALNVASSWCSFRSYLKELKRFDGKSGNFLNKIVSADKTWQDDPETSNIPENGNTTILPPP